jgi:hypothetical protein
LNFFQPPKHATSVPHSEPLHVLLPWPGELSSPIFSLLITWLSFPRMLPVISYLLNSPSLSTTPRCFVSLPFISIWNYWKVFNRLSHYDGSSMKAKPPLCCLCCVPSAWHIVSTQ